jgi:AcrR family transcriptional regulator
MEKLHRGSTDDDFGGSLHEARSALLSSFAELTLSRRYNEFGVGTIVRAAKVARSTFYYHFRGKDDLLLENLRPLVEAFASAPFDDCPSPSLEFWIQHIWEHRGAARQLLRDRTISRLHGAIAGFLRERLETSSFSPATKVSSSIIAEQIAGANVALLQAWINHRITAKPHVVAKEIWRFSRSAAQDLC